MSEVEAPGSQNGQPKQNSDGAGKKPFSSEIANLLVREGLLDEEKLCYANRVKSKLQSHKTILDVIQELGFITAAQIRDTLRDNQVNIRIGDMLVDLGYLRETDLKVALDIQKSAQVPKKLGDLLVEAGLIDEHKFVEILACQLGFPQIDVEFQKIERSLFANLPLSWCRENVFIPISREEGQVVVAFGDPLDSRHREVAQRIFGNDLKPAIATSKSILEALAAVERNAGRGEVAPDEKTIIGMLNNLFEEAIEENASDIHLEPMKDRLRIRFRRDGVMMQHKDLPREIIPQLTSRIKVIAHADIAEKRRHQDGRILFESIRHGFNLDIRVSFFVTIYGEKIVLRLLNKKGALFEIQEIGMAPRMLEHFKLEALDVPTGVMIITGPTGSGKTSTMYSCVNYLNHIDTSIITVEDPVEIVINGISQCSINTKIGVTFEESLRHIVRQDPDVIVLGEIRDNFSAETAIQAALTGHKVLTTFHTEDSIGGLVRLMNMEIEAFLISSTVVCVVAQRLLRRVCMSCAEPYVPSPVELNRLGYSQTDLLDAAFVIGRGCKECRFTGYKGRHGVFELLVMNEMVREAILGKKSSFEIRRISIETSGLVSLLEDGIHKAAQGIISLSEVLQDLPRISKPRPLQTLRRILEY